MIVIDLFCGLGGWTDGALSMGATVYGFDITRHEYATRAPKTDTSVKVGGIDFNGFGTPGYKAVAFKGTAEKRLGPKTGGVMRYPAQLILQDMLTIHGSQFRNAHLIVASPPCQNYSYLAMPWSKSKCPLCKGKKVYFEWQLITGVAPGHMTEWGRPIPCDCKENSRKAKELRAEWEKNGPDNRLFDAPFRIQREAIEATRNCTRCSHLGGYCRGGGMYDCPECRGTGHGEGSTRHIPLIVENVRGAVPWVGPAKAKFGSFYLWGDVEQIGNRVVAGRELADIRAGRGRFGIGVAPESGELKGYGSTWFGIQNNGDTYDQRSVNPVSGQKRNPDGTAHPQGSWFRIADSSQGDRGSKVPTEGEGRRAGIGKGARFTSRDCGAESTSVKQSMGRGDWFSKEARDGGASARYGSKSNARKAASAMIAKIPFPLSSYIARVHMPASQP